MFVPGACLVAKNILISDQHFQSNVCLHTTKCQEICCYMYFFIELRSNMTHISLHAAVSTLDTCILVDTYSHNENIQNSWRGFCLRTSTIICQKLKQDNIYTSIESRAPGFTGYIKYHYPSLRFEYTLLSRPVLTLFCMSGLAPAPRSSSTTP